jgi:hypothetical protein
MRQQRSYLSAREESANAHAAMLGQAISRNAARVFVRLPAWVTVGSANDGEHVAFVRDISPRGIFFYSDWKPTQGQEINFVLQYLSGTNKVRLHLSGMVVRIEQNSANAAFGIAVAFDASYDNVPRAPIRMR